MLVVTGSVTARPDSFEALLEAALAHVGRSRTEPGCLTHGVAIDCEDPLRLVFFEQWADRVALGTHFALPASRDFVRALRSLAAGASTIEIFDASGVENL